MKFARLTLSDRAAAGVYEDRSGPAIEQFFAERVADSIYWEQVLIPDDRAEIEDVLRKLCEAGDIALVVTTGGTGPSHRDVTPEATRSVLDRELPGFGEIMRVQSFVKVPTSILSRATAGTCGKTLIVNLPGNPRAIGECLPLLLPAMVECLDHLGWPRLSLR
jgi:molybdopterin adenylyltransferase